jgi:hypothetical protein
MQIASTKKMNVCNFNEICFLIYMALQMIILNIINDLIYEFILIVMILM